MRAARATWPPEGSAPQPATNRPLRTIDRLSRRDGTYPNDMGAGECSRAPASGPGAADAPAASAGGAPAGKTARPRSVEAVFFF